MSCFDSWSQRCGGRSEELTPAFIATNQINQISRQAPSRLVFTQPLAFLSFSLCPFLVAGPRPFAPWPPPPPQPPTLPSATSQPILSL